MPVSEEKNTSRLEEPSEGLIPEIEKLRMGLGISKTAMAARLGLSPQNYSHTLSGRKGVPGLALRRRLVEAGMDIQVAFFKD